MASFAIKMDLVSTLQKKLQPGDALNPARKALVCQGLCQLSRDGACSAMMIIRAYKDNIDKTKSMGEGDIPYYGNCVESKVDSECFDVTFELTELPDQLLLLLEAFLKEKQ